MSEQCYIHDGQTRRGYLREIERLYPAIHFEFRPVIATDRAVVIAAISQSSEREAVNLAAAVICKQVLKWDARRHDGELVPLTAEHVLRLQPTLLQRLYNVVLGNAPYDADPDDDDSANESDSASKQLAAYLAPDAEKPQSDQEEREGN